MNPPQKTLSSLSKDTPTYLCELCESLSKSAHWELDCPNGECFGSIIDLGLYDGFPRQVLTPEQRARLFEENQKNHKLTRIPGSQFGL